MNRQKLACLGLVLSIFGFLGLNASAQDTDESARSTHARRRAQLAQTLLPPANEPSQVVETAQPTALVSSPEQTEIPLGAYVAVLPETVTVSGRAYFGGEYELNLLAGGRYRLVRNGAFIDDSGTYSVAGDQLQLSSPTPPANLGSGCTGGAYRWQLQGARLTLTSINDNCERRRVELTTQALYRRDPAGRWWRQIGPEGAQVNALLANNNTLYAATSGDGVYRSTDSGQTWLPSQGIGAYFTLALGAFNGNLLAGVNFGQIFISTDNGQTWEFTNNRGSNGPDIRDFAAIGTNLFAATDGGGVLVSTNGGRAWTKAASTGLTNQRVFALAAIGTNLFAGTAGGVFRSTDNAQTWTTINSGLTVTNIRTLAVSGTRLLAGTGVTNGANEVFVTENNGDGWRVFGNGLSSLGANGTALYKLVVNGDRVLATASGGLLVNENGTWQRVFPGLPVNAMRGLVVSGNQLFAGSVYYGVYRYSENGQNGVAVNNGLRSRIVWSALKAGNTLYAGLEDGLLATVDEGRNWTRINLGRITGVNALLSHNNRLYAGTDDGVFVSADGQTWLRAAGLDSSVSYFAASGTTLFAGTYEDGVFRSTDNGQNWTAANTGLTNLSIWALAVNGTNVFAGTEGGGVFRSTDNGQNWTAVNADLPRDGDGAIYVYALAANGGPLFAGVIGEALFRSSDNGQTWTRSDRGISPPFYLTLHAGGGNLYTSGDAAMGCYRSTNNGQDWTPFNAGLDNRFPTTFQVNGANVYATTYGGGLFVSNSLVNQAATVSAASYAPNSADKSIVAAFGPTLATNTASASTQPLPTTLGGTTIKVRDSNGIERLALLFFVAPGQINYQIPAGTATGMAFVTITNADGVGATGEITVAATAPAIFSLNAQGTGAAAALDALTGAAAPFNAKLPNGDPNIIAVFGTGLGGEATDIDGNVNASVTASIGGQAATVLYAGRAPGFTGLNQFNITLPANIAAGTHTLTITRGGRTSNSVTITIR
jgi:uncharacterized protein (TIGR03437 family)